jgi:hypothetical protein
MEKQSLSILMVSGFLLAAGISMGAEKEKVAGMPGGKAMGGMGGMAGKGGMGGGMSMMDMMGHSKMNCMATSDTLADLQKTVQDAEKSDDKVKMKAALQRVESHISGMQAHMSQCSGMMDMMGSMMGGGMMGGGSMGKDKTKESPAAGESKKEDKEDHEKHH